MNELNNEKATTKTAAQIRLETTPQKEYEFLVPLFGEEEAKRMIEDAKPYLENDVFRIILPDPFTAETLPDVDFLVTIGKLNLIKLRIIQRHKIARIKAQIRDLQEILLYVPPYEALDNRYCNYNTAEKRGYFGEHCSYACAFFKENRDALTRDELRAALERSDLNTEDFPKDEALNEKIAQHRCGLFDATEDAAVINERQRMFESVKVKIQELYETEQLHVKYINRITKAINDQRTLPNLPIFADWRSQNYLEKNQVVCTFLSVTSETAFHAAKDDGFEKAETLNVSTETQLFFCKITGKAFTGGPYTGNEPMIFVSSHGETPIMAGELYIGADCSTEKFLNHNATANDVQFTMQPIPSIDQRIPRVMKLGELFELKKHPEYAKMWAYTNLHLWHIKPADIEPMLEAIKNLDI